MKKPKALFNWSGGKDSSLCLYHILQSKAYEIPYLLTSVNNEFQRVSMHGVRVELLEKQAESIGIPLKKIMIPEMPSMADYDNLLHASLSELRKEGIQYSIYGDIFLEDLKKYREDQLAKVDMKGIFPLWKMKTNHLLEAFIDLGFKAVLVCVNEKYLDQSFAGRIIDKDFIKDLPKNVDPCGENGEYHTFVFDGPIFKESIHFEKGEIVYRSYSSEKENKESINYDTGFWYCDLIPTNKVL